MKLKGQKAQTMDNFKERNAAQPFEFTCPDRGQDSSARDKFAEYGSSTARSGGWQDDPIAVAVYSMHTFCTLVHYEPFHLNMVMEHLGNKNVEP